MCGHLGREALEENNSAITLILDSQPPDMLFKATACACHGHPSRLSGMDESWAAEEVITWVAWNMDPSRELGWGGGWAAGSARSGRA